MLKTLKLRNKIKKIKLVLLDVDGVMTDEGIYYDNTGKEYKKFNAKDGFGIETAIDAGIKIAIITGKTSDIVKKRGAVLKIHKIYQGAVPKYSYLERIKKDFNVMEDEIAFICDDVFDIGLLRRVGVKVGVKNACPEIKAIADYVTRHKGGEGGVRDFLEYLLKKKKIWKQNTQKYY